MCDSMTAIDIHFSKLPTPQQLVNKAAGMIQRSKVSLNCITLSYKNEVIELTKDKETGQWSGKGRIAGTTGAELVGSNT